MSLLTALEISLLGVCLWGLLAILLTSQFSTLVILLCIGAMCAIYKLRKNGWQPSPMLANIAAILVFAVSGALFFFTLNLLVATVYLFLFLQVTKYATRQNLTEMRWCYLISLFHIIGASVITTAISFGIMLVIYIFLLLTSLRLYVMARELESVIEPEKKGFLWRNKPSRSQTPSIAMVSAGIPRGMLGSGILLTLLVVALSSILFSIIPRLQTQNLFQTYGPPPDEPAMSAFAENVEFGSFTEIQYDDGVALFVEPTGKSRPHNIRMRGVALDTFDGKSWKRTNHVNHGGSSHEFRPILTRRLYPKFTYNIIQPPGVTNFLFGDTFPVKITVPRQFVMLIDSRSQSAHLSEMPPKEFQYQVTSLHEDLADRQDPARTPITDRPANDLFKTTFDGDESASPSSMFTNEIVEQFTRRLNRRFHSRNTSDSATSIIESGEDRDSEPDDMEERETLERDRPVRLRGHSPASSDDFGAENRERMRDYRRTPRERIQYYLWKCTQLPDQLNSGRVADLAHEWTDDEETTFAKALSIETHLRNEYGYSLAPRAKGNFIDDFLFEVREGHCEYFATSMAVLLRNIGIPARIVNGYYSTEWNAISSNFTVRNRDAHSWVEVWLGDDYGWMTFDPTPPGGVGRRSDHSQILASLSRIMDAVRVRWYRYVVDYSITDQVTAMKKLIEWRQRFIEFLGNSDIMGIGTKTSAKITLGDFSRELNWKPALGVLFIVLSLLGWQVTRILINQRRRLTSIRFYDEILRLLAQRGFKISRGQTPREFTSVISRQNTDLNTLNHATEIYYRSRYEDYHPTAEELKIISDLKRALRRTRQK